MTNRSRRDHAILQRSAPATTEIEEMSRDIRFRDGERNRSPKNFHRECPLIRPRWPTSKLGPYHCADPQILPACEPAQQLV